MKTELKATILNKIKKENLKAFSCYDFTDLSSYKTISKCLERMEDNKEITRITQGIYCLSTFDEYLNLPVLPSINDVAKCLARKHKWIIAPSGNLALNLMNLSTQVPANYVYLSSGPYKEYKIYEINVSFKRTTTREIIDYSEKTLLLIQCIKAIGKNRIDEKTINNLRKQLSSKEKEKALNESLTIQTWIRNIIVLICEE